MNKIVKKFGGISVNNIKLLKGIIKPGDIVVVSAPGKDGDKGKVTDVFELLYRKLCAGENIEEVWNEIKSRFEKIIGLSNAKINLKPYFDEIEANFPKKDHDYLVSRGEYLTAIIFSNLFHMNLVDAKDCVRFNNGRLDIDASVPLIKRMVFANSVVPGFYGADDKNIKTMGRGGSDVTGALISKAIEADELWTYKDKEGVSPTLPQYYPYADYVEHINYDTMSEFSKNGATILHPKAVEIAKNANIPIKVKGLYNYVSKGTLVSTQDENKYVKCMGENSAVFQLLRKNHNLVGKQEICLITGNSQDTQKIYEDVVQYLDIFKHNAKVIKHNTGVSVIVDKDMFKIIYVRLYRDIYCGIVNQKIVGEDKIKN